MCWCVRCLWSFTCPACVLNLHYACPPRRYWLTDAAHAQQELDVDSLLTAGMRYRPQASNTSCNHHSHAFTSRASSLNRFLPSPATGAAIARLGTSRSHHPACGSSLMRLAATNCAKSTQPFGAGMRVSVGACDVRPNSRVRAAFVRERARDAHDVCEHACIGVCMDYLVRVSTPDFHV